MLMHFNTDMSACSIHQFVLLCNCPGLEAAGRWLEERGEVVKYTSRCKDGCSYSKGKVNAFALQLCKELSALPFRANHRLVAVFLFFF